MIEFRYLEKEVPAPEYGKGVAKIITKLQYRIGSYLPNIGEVCWGDWIDVPTVKGE